MPIQKARKLGSRQKGMLLRLAHHTRWNFIPGDLDYSTAVHVLVSLVDRGYARRIKCETCVGELAHDAFVITVAGKELVEGLKK